jgi:hypothetical protein
VAALHARFNEQVAPDTAVTDERPAKVGGLMQGGIGVVASAQALLVDSHTPETVVTTYA